MTWRALTCSRQLLQALLYLLHPWSRDAAGTYMIPSSGFWHGFSVANTPLPHRPCLLISPSHISCRLTRQLY